MFITRYSMFSINTSHLWIIISNNHLIFSKWLTIKTIAQGLEFLCWELLFKQGRGPGWPKCSRVGLVSSHFRAVVMQIIEWRGCDTHLWWNPADSLWMWSCHLLPNWIVVLLLRFASYVCGRSWVKAPLSSRSAGTSHSHHIYSNTCAVWNQKSKDPGERMQRQLLNLVWYLVVEFIPCSIVCTASMAR